VALAPGTQLGGYTITSQIGLGGMGVVYRARDTKLKRDVAIKMLPWDVASDPERLARLQREAEVLASLNHPNIAHLYGIEGSQETTALVMELVEGPTLADRIAAGPIPIEEALLIVGQIVEALEAAHEQGVVHRDMKPANIKLRPDGVVKVLDFGLAKALDPASSQSSYSLAPTMTTPAATEAGSILGTAPYMSPEQAIGKPVDKRTDIWAFGCTVYEMLTGTAPFARETKAETLVAILEREPDWAALPAATPASLRRLLMRCLTKDARRRLRDIGDARLDLADEALAGEASAPQRSASRRRIVQSIAALVLTAVITGSLVWVFKPSPAVRPSSSVARLVIVPPPGQAIDAGNFGVTISPNGRRVAYVAGDADRKRIYVRDVEQFDSLALPGSEGGDAPFFSPDGQWVGFVAAGKLRKSRFDGGQPQTITEAIQTVSAFAVASWETDDNIYFTPTPGTGIWQVPATGGTPVAVTMLRESENSHRWPQLLPGGKALLFSAATASDSQVYVQFLATGERRPMVKGVGARYLPSGHLVYVQGNALMAVRFDVNRFEVVGAATPVLSGFMQISRLRNSSVTNLVPQISVSTAGTIAYVPAPSKPLQEALVWVSRAGVETTTGASGGVYFQPRLSPDGSRVALTVGGEDNDDVWQYEFARGSMRRVTSAGNNSFPLWSRDGRRLAHVSDRAGPDNMYVRSLDSTKDERLLVSAEPNYPFAWTQDNTLVFVRPDPITLQDIFVLRKTEAEPMPILNTPFGEGAPVLSLDDRWLAYVSNESGRNEIYVKPFERPGEQTTVSTDGGNEPVWSPNGRELFFRNGNDMMVVDISLDPVLSAGKPRRLFTGTYERSLALWPNYDVANDGQSFLMVKKLDSGDAPMQINVVLNWIDELNRLLPK
jgi:Tol biopolymer transport system component